MISETYSRTVLLWFSVIITVVFVTLVSPIMHKHTNTEKKNDPKIIYYTQDELDSVYSSELSGCTEEKISTLKNASYSKFKVMVDSNSCSKLGIKEIHKVGKSEHCRIAKSLDTVNYVSKSWQFGWYPYKTCNIDDDINITRGKHIILTVANSAYIDVVPTFAKTAFAVNASCALVAMDKEICEAARQHSCTCLYYGSHSSNSKHSDEGQLKSGWHRSRVDGIKLRFNGTMDILKSGHSVLMHDADVFFTVNSLRAVLDYIDLLQSSPHHSPDWVIQHNGRRTTAFDELNLGFSWMKSGGPVENILECSLDLWDFPVFHQRKGETQDQGYYARSQPRVNHIIEQAMGSMEVPPKICLFNKTLLDTSGSFKHMTGYATVASKITCAREQGYLYDEKQKMIAYSVPKTASVDDQFNALLAALYIAENKNIKLAVPSAFYEKSQVSFCLLFTVGRIPANLFATPLSKEMCSDGFNNITTVECLDFSKLIKSKNRYVEKSAMEKIKTCDPHSPSLRATHSCV